eukprot:6612305-Karenia_brevis.AAC.1
MRHGDTTGTMATWNHEDMETWWDMVPYETCIMQQRSTVKHVTLSQSSKVTMSSNIMNHDIQ